MNDWIDMRKEQPEDEAFVLIHGFGWKDWYYEPAIYRRGGKLFQRCSNFMSMIDEQLVEYWMKIPPVPERKDNAHD